MFSLAKSLPKHTSPLPHTQNAQLNAGLAEQLGTALILIFLTRLAPWPIRHIDPRYDWLETCCGRAGTELVARPQGASAAVVSHLLLACNQCCLCLKKKKGGMSGADFQTQPVGPAGKQKVVFTPFECVYLVISLCFDILVSP